MANELNSERELNGPIEANSTSPGSSPDHSVESSGRPRNAKGHKPECTCTLCARIQARIARGEPSQAEVREQRKQQREEQSRQKQNQRQTLLSRKRQELEQQKTALEASIETQAQLGARPNVALAGRIAGIEPRRAQQISSAENFVETALKNAGVTDEKLAAVAAEGLEAYLQKVITDENGNVIDAVNTPDFKNRHAFWADLLRIKKILGSDAETGGGSGGLIIITPDMARVLPGHPPACVCDECKLAWEDKAAHLRRAAMKERAILTSTVNSQQQDPRADAIDVEETEVEELEYDDFGPVE